MTRTELLCIVTALILPAVQKDMGKEAEDLLDAIHESAEYAADIVAAVESNEEPDGDDGEKVEVIPPRRRHA
jgi:hypothetical protein